jgi:starch phosphorylase
MQRRWIATTQTFLDLSKKVACYLSAEFLMGPQLGNNLLNLEIEDEARAALAALGQDLDEVLACEEEPGLGNGGLGRLAACYLDSLAALERPAIGYGIRYEFGIFDQEIRDGWQVERTDNWLVNGNPWEIPKPDVSYRVLWGGHTESYVDGTGDYRVRWVPAKVLKGISFDTPIQGYNVNTCDTLTLWSARAVESFALDAFNTGDYYKAVEDEVTSETVTKVLYPNDERRRASGCACCSSTSSCPAPCRTSSTSWRTWRTFLCRRYRSSSRYSSTTRIRRSASPNSCGS